MILVFTSQTDTYESAGSITSQPIFTLSLNPDGLHVNAPQPLCTTIFNHSSVLGRLRLRPRRHPIAQDLCK